MNMEIFGTNRVFNSTDKFNYEPTFQGGWFDYCPVDGIQHYKSDKYCLHHVKVIEKHNSFLIIRVPNFSHPEFEQRVEDYKHLVISEIEKSKIWEYMNIHNSSRSLFKFDGINLNEEDLFIMGGVRLIDTIVETYDDFFEILTNINDKDLVV